MRVRPASRCCSPLRAVDTERVAGRENAPPFMRAADDPDDSLRPNGCVCGRVCSSAAGELSIDTVCGVSAVVALVGFMIELNAAGSARTVIFELLDTFRRFALSDELVSLRLRSDSEGSVDREGATASGGKARDRSEMADWEVLDVGVGEGS